jgi:peptidyl-prolyl cis-trans isomerase C
MIDKSKGKLMNGCLGAMVMAVGCLGLAACHLPGMGGEKAPTGEVAATVAGKEITVRDLRAEIAGANLTDPKQAKQAERQALQQIVVRTLLADAARRQGVDKTPDFAVAKQRAIDSLLAQALEAKVVDAVPPPSREEAQSFVSSHPDIFAERKIFVLDQLRMPRPADPKIYEELKPLNTLDDVITVLNHENIKFERGDARLDAAGADPKLVDAVVKLPPHELFLLPANGLLLVNQIKDVTIQPFTGDAALAYAVNLLKRQHTEAAVQREFGSLIAKQAKTVRYNKAYQPAQPPEGAKPA